MKITTTAHNVNPSTELLLCFDVSKDHLNLFTRYEQGGRLVRIEDEIDNATDATRARPQPLRGCCRGGRPRAAAHPLRGHRRL